MVTTWTLQRTQLRCPVPTSGSSQTTCNSSSGEFWYLWPLQVPTHGHTHVSTDRHIYNNENKIKKYIAHCLNDSWRLVNIMRIQVWNSGKGRWSTQLEPSMVSALPIWEKWRQDDQELKATYQVPGEPWLHATIFLKNKQGSQFVLVRYSHI